MNFFLDFKICFVDIFFGYFFFSSKFKILQDSAKDNEEKLLFVELLNENLPLLLSVWISLKSDIIWKIDKPFSFRRARLAKVKGNDNMNLPATANKIAKIISPIIINILRPLDNFFDETLLISLKSK